MSCSSSGFSPQGEKRFPVPSERGRITVAEEDESGRRVRCPQHPAFTWVSKVSVCLAEDAQEVSGAMRPGWDVRTGGEPWYRG